MLGMMANYLPKDDPRRAKYVDFVKGQTDYILGDNPAGVNFVVGAEANSPKSVHHRGASGTYDSQDLNAKPVDHNVYTIWGALAGGPSKDDSYRDSRKDYEMNEVALDYNGAFQMNLAFLVKEGLSIPDPDSVKNHERSFPKKAETPDITVTIEKDHIKVASGSNMVCSSWCLEFTSEYEIENSYHSILHQTNPKYIICNERETNYLDGEGTPQDIQIAGKNNHGSVNLEISDVVVMCNGWHAPQRSHQPTYKPENGRKYQIINGGGPGQTIPLFKETKCWPGFLCDESGNPTKSTNPSTSTNPVQDPVSNDDCFAIDLGYKCCNNNEVQYVDENGKWGYTDDWCGIGGTSKKNTEEKQDLGMFGDYPYCSGCESNYSDEDGEWYFIDNTWCKINEKKCNTKTCEPVNGYPCCENPSIDVSYVDNDGNWGVENNNWCIIKN